MLTSIRGLLAATVLAGCALTATPAFADETDPPAEFTISGNVAMVTDYRFRGVSFTAGDPAIQGGININHKSGFYVGAWGSNLEDSDVYGSMELDLFGGWSGDVAPGLTVDVGLLYYAYPNGHVGKAEYFEPYASVSTTMGPVSAKLGVAYAWSQESLGDEDNFYIYGNVDVGIPNTPITVSGHLGYTDGVLSPKRLTGVSNGGGFDYSIGASFAITSNLSIGASYIGVDGASIDGFTDDTVVGTITLSF